MVGCPWLKTMNLAMNVDKTWTFKKGNVVIVVAQWNPGCGFTNILSVEPVLCWPPGALLILSIKPATLVVFTLDHSVVLVG